MILNCQQPAWPSKKLRSGRQQLPSLAESQLSVESHSNIVICVAFFQNAAKTMALKSLIRNNIDSLLAAAAGFTIIFLFCRHDGIGLCPDGVVYTTTAQNFAHHFRLFDFSNHAMVDFPAGYPIFLSLITLLTGVKPLMAGPLLNEILFALTIFFTGYLMESFEIRSRWQKIAVLSCVVLSPGLLEVYSMMWSETIFILLLLLFLKTMQQYFRHHSLKMLLWASVITALATDIRYAGVTIIGTAGLLILMDNYLPLKQKIKHILIFGFISSSLLVVNLIRNYRVGGTLTGHREKSLTPLLQNMHDAGSVFYDWLPFTNGHYNGAAISVAIVVMLTFIIWIREYRSKKRLVTLEDMSAFFAFFYISFFLVAASISRFEPIDSRFLSPAFIPLLWSLSTPLVSLRRKVPAVSKKWSIALGFLVFALFQYGQLDADYETWDGVKDAGIPGYTEDQWQLSPTVEYMKQDSLLFAKGVTVYSDADDAVYFFTQKRGFFLPHRQDTASVNRFLKNKKCFVIWFNDGENPDLVGKRFISDIKKMKVARQFDDGTIYEYGMK
jgi:hypothetical protein